MKKRSLQSKLDIRLGRPGNRAAQSSDTKNNANPATARQGEIGNVNATPDALLSDPELLLFDEPFDAAEPKTKSGPPVTIIQIQGKPEIEDRK